MPPLCDKYVTYRLEAAMARIYNSQYLCHKLENVNPKLTAHSQISSAKIQERSGDAAKASEKTGGKLGLEKKSSSQLIFSLYCPKNHNIHDPLCIASKDLQQQLIGARPA